MRRLIIVGLLILVPVFSVVLIVSGIIRKPQPNVKQVSLTYWTVQDDKAALADIIAAYQARHPYVKISVVQQRPEQYREALVEAWAKGTGPDIFSLPNQAVGTYADFITPLPEKTTVYVYELKRVLFQKQQTISQVATPSLTPARLNQDFVDVVASDVIRNGKIYALPLSLDTLAVYVNRDLLNTSGVVNPPTTWRELVTQSGQLTILDSTSRVVQSAVALGRAENIAHSADLLALLMQQNGTAMTDATGRQVQFDRGGEDYYPGLRALEFYTDFSDPTKETFSWTADMPNSLDAFTEGKVAYAFGTLADRAAITARARGFTVEVAPMFHINDDGTDTGTTTSSGRTKINAAVYWVEAVAKRSAHPDEAWDFVQFMTKSGVVESYLQKTKRVSPLRKILATQVNMSDLGVFATQALTARNWYHGEGWPQTETLLADLITALADRTATSLDAITRAAKQIQLTYTKAP